MESPTTSKGTAAALGPRRPFEARVRAAALRRLIWLEEKARRFRPTAYEVVEFVPAVRNRGELADLSARVNWFLPGDFRQAGVAVRGAERYAGVTPGDAWYLDPELVTDPEWQAPSGRGRLRVIHRVTPWTLLRYLLAPHRSVIVDRRFAYGADEGWFRVARRVCDVDVPGAGESIQRLQQLARPGGSALVLATGPTAQLVDPATVTQELRITCNSVVKDEGLLRTLRPDVIAFGDPVFHYGPSRYAAAFRADLRRALTLTDATIVTTELFVEPLLAAMPEVRSRLVVIRLSGEGQWRWPTPGDVTARATGNVLTNLMLPVAFALADDVAIAGCDGRDPNETYYWKHNAATQYSDEMMRTAFEAHDAFFRFRDYADYYALHCQQLEEFLSTAEAAGKQSTGLTPSHIPALRSRGAPDLAV